MTKLNLKIPFVVKSFPNQAPEGYAGREAFAAGIRALKIGALEDAELDKWFDAALLECIDAGVSIPNGGVKLQLVLSDAVAEAAKFAQEAEEKADVSELVKLRRTAREQQQAIRAARARGTVVARFLRSAWRSVVCGSLFGYRQLGQCDEEC